MSCSKPFAEKLQAMGFRMTPQRHVILHILKSSGDHLSPSQVYEMARESAPGLTETTVYRTLEFLARNGLVVASLRSDGHLVYEIIGEQHHHLICKSCGYEVEIPHAMVEPLYAQLEAASGFELTGIHVTFFGLCPGCKSSEAEGG
jgi:Fe2+ or Zn2+ uptake regulation protein